MLVGLMMTVIYDGKYFSKALNLEITLFKNYILKRAKRYLCFLFA